MFQTKDIASGAIRYSSISRAVVIDNNDPSKRGRIRVSTPVLGETSWIPYLTAPGMFSVPEIEDVVYIECDGGDYNHPVAWGNLNRGSDDNLKFPETFQRITPTNRGMYSPAGHLLEIDDGSDIAGSGKGFRFTGSEGTILHIKEEPAENSVEIKAVAGTTLKINGTEDSIVLKAAFGDTLSVSATNGIQASTPSGTSLSMKNGNIDTSTTGDTTFLATGSMSFVAQGSMGITAPNGPISLNAGAGDFNAFATNITLLGGGATLKLGTGTVALGAGGTEVIDQLCQALGAFIDNAPTIVSTSVGPGVLSPAVVTLLTTIKTALTGIKGSL